MVVCAKLEEREESEEENHGRIGVEAWSGRIVGREEEELEREENEDRGRIRAEWSFEL